MKYFYFIFLISFSLSAQIKGIVKDSISGESIPYVSIWIENKSTGTSSEENGTFVINAKETNRLQFSCLGYKDTTLKINENGIYLLSPEIYQINEVIVFSAKRTKVNKIGNSEFSRSSHLQGAIPQILAKKFDYDLIVKETNFLKEIEIFTKSPIKDAILKIRILEFDTITSLPGKSLVDESILVKVGKGRKKTIVDVSNQNISIPKGGIIIGIENVIVESNKYFQSHGDKIETEYYAPQVILNYVEEEKSYMFVNLKWFKRKKQLVEFGNNKGKKMVIEPAINIVLTN